VKTIFWQSFTLEMVEYFQNSTCPEIKEKKIDDECEINVS
jgi:hypothetical protein